MRKIFKVKDKKLKFIPNLENYGEEYKNFSWQQVEKEFSDNWNIAFHIDKHKSDKIALYWEDEGSKKFNFKELSLFSNKFANSLKEKGVKKGDRCFIFLPRIPELYFAFLGILKIGAVATILFPAFGKAGVSDRLKRAEAKVLITNSELYERVDKKLVKKVIVVNEKKFKQEFENASEKFIVEKMNKEDVALMMFTSSTSGTPVEGIILTHHVVVQQYYTGKWVLDFKESDVYWCTADPGWITGVVYGIISPWANGVSIVAYEGRFSAEKWFEILEKYKVSVLYTAPTAIRMLLKEGIKTKPKYLRHVCSVGEALNPETITQVYDAWKIIIHDTYWQTETGAMIICNFLSEDIKLGSMGKAVPGIRAEIVDDAGKILEAGKEGNIALEPDFPSLMKSVWHREDLYKSYFKHGWYITGDRGYKDEQGYFFCLGRKDDIIKTSGERVSPYETESSLLEYPGVVEAAVVGKPDELRGAILVAFLVLKDKKKASEDEKEKTSKTKVFDSDQKSKEEKISDIKKFVKENLAGHAYPREIYFVDELPKNRSGKIVRMVLKQLLVHEKPVVASLVKPKVIEEIKRVIEAGRD